MDISLFYLINTDGRNVLLDALMPAVSNEKNFYAPLAIAWLLLILAGTLCGLVLAGISRSAVQLVEKKQVFHEVFHHYPRI